jgi:DNA replicative helicase MCM subunit Mcm2 (Cdc46/Mcm family)
MTEENNNVELPKELIEYFEKISKNKPIEYLSPMIAPHLVGDEWKAIRKTTLLQMASHGEQQLKPGEKKKRIHQLLLGKAGVGKTEILLFFQDYISGTPIITAEMTSKVGLCGDARGNEVTPGLLVEYDGKFLCIDELDKMSSEDMNGLLQAMEEGYYSINKGKHRKRCKAEIRAIASANIARKIQAPLLDRFDFIHVCTTASKDDRANNVPKITNSFFGGDEEKNANILNGYMIWLKDTTPSGFEDKPKIDDRIARFIRSLDEPVVNDASYRFLEMSILRVAWAIAKLNHRELITVQDTIDACIYKNSSLKLMHTIKKEREGKGK